MEYSITKPEKDFVKRTVELAKELADHRYCTTLQTNLLFGTIMLPKSHWYQSLDQHSINNGDIGGVTISYKNSSISLKVLLHCLRNGIAHWRENGNQNISFGTISTNGINEINKVAITGSGRVNSRVETVTVEFDVSQNGIVNFMETVYGYLL